MTIALYGALKNVEAKWPQEFNDITISLCEIAMLRFWDVTLCNIGEVDKKEFVQDMLMFEKCRYRYFYKSYFCCGEA